MEPTAKESPLLWVDVKVETAQLSPAVGAVQLTAAEQTPASAVWVMSAGVPVMAGFSSSVTVTVKLEEEVLPEGSVAVYVTVVVPTEKVSPEPWEDVIVEEQLSESVGSVQVTTALQSPASLVWVMFEGMPEMAGASTSLTVIVKDVVVVLPQSSSAV